jgi:hypothetical protein
MKTAAEPLALSPADAPAYIGLSRRALARFVASRTILARKVGRRTLIDGASLRALYEAQPVIDGPQKQIAVDAGSGTP